MLRIEIYVLLLSIFVFSGRAQQFIIHDTHTHGFAGAAANTFHDALSGASNPASLSMITSANAGFFYTRYHPEHLLLAGGVAMPVQENEGIALGYFGSKTDFVLTDIANRASGKSSFQTHYLFLGFGKNMIKNLRFGINGVYYISTVLYYPQFTEQAAALDFALMYHLPAGTPVINNLSIGFVGKHLIQTYDEEPLQKELRSIVEKKIILPESIVTLLVNYRHAKFDMFKWEDDFMLGFDYFYDLFYINTGYCTSNKYIALGGGLIISNFVIGYSYGKFDFPSDSLYPHHTVSFSAHM